MTGVQTCALPICTAPPALRALVDEVRSLVPPVAEDRVLGPELGRLAEHFTERVFAVE